MSGAIVAISFDAGGTLLELREPVGATYARHARALGLAVEERDVERGFQLAFAAAPPLAGPPGVHGPALLDFERAWWRDVVIGALGHALGGDARGAGARSQLERVFDDLFAHYASAAAWDLFPDVLPALDELAQRDVRVGILSNFDGRLHRLVDELGLRPYLSAVVVSSEAGATKPSPGAFGALARALGEPAPTAFVHVGDSLGDDVRGAHAVGWRAVWLARDPANLAEGADRASTVPVEAGDAPPGTARIASLSALADLLDALAAGAPLD